VTSRKQRKSMWVVYVWNRLLSPGNVSGMARSIRLAKELSGKSSYLWIQQRLRFLW